KVYQAMCYSEGEKFSSATEVVQASYEKQVYDEFVIPAVITDTNNQPVGKVKTGDSLISFNFRPDRAIQLTQCFANDYCIEFELGENHTTELSVDHMTDYSDILKCSVAYGRVDLKNTIGVVLEKEMMKQICIDVTEKFLHVTYFMSGGCELEFEGE